MSDWRVRRHYGFGAARVRLAPTPHLVSGSLSGAMRDAGVDFYLSSLSPMIMAAFMVTALFVTVSEDRGYTDIEVMMIARDIHGMDEEITPSPPIVEPEPSPPPVQKIAQKKPAPPPPKKVVEKPKPPPVQKIAKVKPKRQLVKKRMPKPEMAALAPLVKEAPPPTQRKSVKPKAAMPTISFVPAIAPALVLEQVEEPERPRRFAAVRARASSKRPKADLGPPIAARPLSAPAPEPPPSRSRRGAPRAHPAAPRMTAPLDFAAAAAPAPAAPWVVSKSARRSRPASPTKRNRRAAPPPKMAPALAAALPTAKAGLDPAAARSRDRDRTQRNAATHVREDRSGGRHLRGVPLASLAACLSDREEDALKRRLLAAVTAQRDCVSAAGAYRFVETKNLNAFLMTIERAPGRPVADRCIELSYALECVAR
jgi:hypothetical protein